MLPAQAGMILSACPVVVVMLYVTCTRRDDPICIGMNMNIAENNMK